VQKIRENCGQREKPTLQSILIFPHQGGRDPQARRGYTNPFFIVLAVLLSLFASRTQAAENGQSLSQAQVEEALRRYVLERSTWREEQVEVELRSFSPRALPEGPVTIAILKPSRGITPGPHRFLIGLQVNDREEARMWVDSEVRVFAEVVVSSQPLAHFEPLSPEKVRLERRNLGELPPQPLTSLEPLDGKQMTRPVEVNQVLTEVMVELPRVIRRGSVVTLVYESAGLHVETSGRAVEPGRVGERIRVENPSSGKVLEGRVLDDRTVQVN
jgi:flagella basal body P-ring formation protein FlgA